MTGIWYEIFPVTLSSQHPVLLGPVGDDQVSPWKIKHQPLIHPNTLVVEQMMNFFDPLFDSEKMIIHSTSWRYEQPTDQLLITYLAVLPQGDWLDQWRNVERIVVEPIGVITMVYGDHLASPSSIDRTHVLAHALDHLAQLATYDPAIQKILEPAWYEILRQRTPRGAGYLREMAERALAFL